MAVYTIVEKENVARLLKNYAIGRIAALEPVSSGIENTNYFLTTEKIPEKTTNDIHASKNSPQNSLKPERYVLTIFEYLQAQDLPFFVSLIETLHQNKLPVPKIIKNLQGQPFQSIAKKPFIIQSRCSGRSLLDSEITPKTCRQIGEQLARIHLSARNNQLQQPVIRNRTWLNEQIKTASSSFSDSNKTALMLTQWQQLQKLYNTETLPKGIIHGDIFPDNVLFDNDVISGVIDFFQAGQDWLLYDIVITSFAWCTHPTCKQGIFEKDKLGSLVSGYQALRPLTDEENYYWSDMVRWVCLRLWVSRLLTLKQLITKNHCLNNNIHNAISAVDIPADRSPDIYYYRLKYYGTHRILSLSEELIRA